MNTLQLDKDIVVFCLKADSFPDGVLQAHQQLHSLIAYNPQRDYFGISHPDKTGKIIYKAAAEELVKGELQKHHLEEKIIPPGKYIYIDINNFMKNIPLIGKAFEELLKDKRIDKNGFCIEWYITQENCRCMIKIIS